MNCGTEPEMGDLFTASALAAATGATMRQIDYWTRKGYLVPVRIEGRPSKGTGNTRIYSESEVAVARALLVAHDLMRVAEAARADYEEKK